MLETTIEIALTIFVVLMLAAQLLALRFKIPYTLILVFIGIGVTTLSTVALTANPVTNILQTSIQWIRSLYTQLVSSGLFVGLVVPPLIFEAMMHIRRRELRAVIRPSLALATVGVLLSTIIVGIAVWKLEGLSLFSSLLFAAIVAPTDTITVLQIFKHVKVPAKLSTLMDLEAGLNDATAIVIFTAILSLSAAGLANASIIQGSEFFLYDFFGGILVGIIVASIARLVHAKVNDKLAETTLTMAAVYGSYVLATGIGASGLIAVVIVGLYFGNTTLKSALSKRVRFAVVSFWEIAAFIGNAVAFLLIGFETNLALFADAGILILVAYTSTLIARAVVVYPTLAIFNQAEKNRKHRMPLSWSNVAMFGGVRGALSIALVAALASSGAVSSADLSKITTLVLGVVFISIIAQVPILSRYASGLFGRHKKPQELHWSHH